MKEIICKNARQLDICLRMLYAENIGFQVNVFENEKRKICYGVTPETDDDRIAVFEEQFKMLIG